MSQLFGAQQALVESQYRRFLVAHDSVDAEWQAFFAQLAPETIAALQASIARNGTGAFGAIALASDAQGDRNEADLAWRISRIASAYRWRGHLYAQLDPLGLSNPPHEDIDPAAYGISDADLGRRIPTDVFGFETATAHEIIEHLRRTYCGSVGYEVMHVEDLTEREWLLSHIEGPASRTPVTNGERVHVLEHLTDAQELERFLHTQYVGAKRFSLEGLETLIPMLHLIVDASAQHGVTDVVLGMAHRGRLNVLVNLLRKRLRDLFTAFDDADSAALVGRGDVKYHLGYTTPHRTPAGQEVTLSLCFNPSHLEFVDPVVMGRARAMLDRRGDGDGAGVLPIAIHGDAAFAGQGIVMETLNLAELEGYRVGGTIHIVTNNQVGFTTSPHDARSSRYASDVVRFMRVPVFHVNAEDLDAVVRVTRLASAYRARFRRDVCIDLIGYRRYGHNEADEPRYTQPRMYRVIDEKKSVRDAFAEELIRGGAMTAADDARMLSARRERMVEALQDARKERESAHSPTDALWAKYVGGLEGAAPRVGTGVPEVKLRELLAKICDLSSMPSANPKVVRLYQQRARSFEPGETVDWGTGELLAYASLVAEGTPVRLTGQDARRGTFSHRHAIVVDGESGERFSPIERVATGTARFDVFDSPLSEAACLGFEYGYTLDAPDTLVLWEAQFGDFANGAQVIIDQFIAAGEDKWGKLTGLTMLLPHGYEGQGPEHSYARLGRFLQLCAEDNMQVCDCTTPAQYFHLLRRQALRPWRKPLVVMTPKSLLRHKRCVSTLDELVNGSFRPVLPDTSGTPASSARRVLLCAGRIYFDLEAEREKRGASDVHIVRIEQFYPLDHAALAEVLSPYAAGTELFWVQDEPWNMGAWYFMKVRLQALFGDELRIHCVSRAESASPATGSAAAHRLESQHLMDAAFAAAAPRRSALG
jgi:2-oxoglutarate dehydrogenase E1 component